MDKVIAHRRDQDCRENRLLDDITEYMNSKSRKDIFYNITTKLVYNHSSTAGIYYSLYTSVFRKTGQCVSISTKNVSIYINKDDAKEFFRLFKIKETIRNIEKLRGIKNKK